MSNKNPDRKRARALQDRTGWSYCECLRCVRTMTPEGIDALIKLRAETTKQRV